MKTEFDPKTHIGKVNGVVWPSVTQLLQEFKLIDYSSVPFARLEEKRIIGSVVDRATSFVDNGSIDYQEFAELYPKCVGYLDAYRKFREIENFEPVYKDTRYWSKKWKFHGAPDESGIRLSKISKSEWAITDYKCTWKMYESTGTQLSGYELLLLETLGIQIRKRFGLQLKPSGNYDLVEFKDPSDMQEFQACDVLHWAKRLKYKTSKGVTTT